MATPRFLLPPEGKIAPRLTALLVPGFLALLAAGGGAAWVTRQNQTHTSAVVHTYEVEKAIVEVRRVIEEAEATRRGALLAPATTAYRDGYYRAAAELPRRLAALTRLTADNPRQRDHLDGLRLQLGALAQRRAETMALVERGDHRGALAAFRADAEASSMRAVRFLMERMAREERRLLAIRDRDLRITERGFYAVLALAAVLLAALAVIALLTVLAYTRDLARSRDATQALADSLEGMVAERTEDLTRANEEIQRFAYIVSHDLRSPLVNVMGFTAELEAATGQLGALVDAVEAEAPRLLSEEARLSAREDLPEAIGFIRASTQKMDRLINAILQLSRQGRRQLAPERIDVAQLVGQIRDTLTHRLTDADATLEVAGTLPEVISDRFSLDQIFSNLIENAVKYLRPGVPGRITVSGRREPQRVIYAIADNGRGIDPRDHARVFDLFRRSGAQDKPGEGIGLATVRALVFRLGGTIGVKSNLGQGATFTLSLPLTLESQPSESRGKSE